MARQALEEAGLPFDLIRAEGIRRGDLARYRMLFVPGGWASNKIAALGDQGLGLIRHFVESGGSYLGICGGGGMATESGLGLLPIRRRASADRVPSFSGPILLTPASHAIWQQIDTPLFHAWWPSQFQAGGHGVSVLARYGKAQSDAFSSDIPVADGGLAGWVDLEERYGILLDPARLEGEPCVLEGRFGQGRVILSLIHFDTPGDRNGTRVLRNLWHQLAGSSVADAGSVKVPDRSGPAPPVAPAARERVAALQAAVDDLIATGARHFLWYWRTPLLLQWRRGVRGLEYATLSVMLSEIARCLGLKNGGSPPGGPEMREPRALQDQLAEIAGLLMPFCEKAKRLVIAERFYMQSTLLSPVRCDDAQISRLREELFASAMSHGGAFKRLIDVLDLTLYGLIRGD
jgi:putative intracellular protease/amidase